MASVLFLDKTQKVIRSFDSCDLAECVQTKEITTNASELMSDNLSATSPYFKNIDDARYIAVSNTQKNDFTLYYIIKTEEDNGLLSFEASNFAVNELNAYIIKDVRPQARDYKYIIPQILADSGSDWVLGVCEPVNTVTTNFYYTSVREALKSLQAINGEFTFTVEIVDGVITKKKINCYNKIGKVTNTRFEYGSEILKITKQQDRQSIVTSIIGRGKGEEVGDGYGRRLEFSDVVWSKAKGDPLDKPKGQNFLEFPEMTREYGIPTVDGMKARKGVLEFDDVEDPKELIRLTYENLVYYSRPLVEYKTDVLDAEAIGNTITIHWGERGLHYQTRVFKIENDYVKGTVKASVGDNLSANQSMPKQLAIAQTVAKNAERESANASASANSKNTNYYSTAKDGFPEKGKKGDLFFRTYNGVTTVYQYDGKEWLILIDDSWQDEFEQEMQDKLDQAKQENDAAFADLDKQLSDAQTAIDNVDASNQALSDAVDQANKDIKAVDDAASQAMSTALDGKSLAENAKELGQEALDNFKNLSIGGRNLLSNSAFLKGPKDDGLPDLWIKGGATATSKLVSITDLNQIATGVEITQTEQGQSGLRTWKFVENIINDKSYVQTFWIKNLASEPLKMRIQVGERNKDTNAVTYTSINQDIPSSSGWTRLTRIFTTKSTTNGLYFYLYTDTTTPNAHYILAAPKLEEGTVPTDWTPAPEDTQVKIEQLENGLKTTVSQSQYNADQSVINSQISSVTQTANSINSVVTDLTNGMPTGASIISQISDSVSIMVEKNDVINQINVSTEGILIAGEKVHITGTTLIDDAIITTAMIKELDASVITTGTLAANLIVPTAGNMLMNSEFQSNTFFDGWISGGSITGADFYDSAATFTDEYGGNSTMAGINTINLEVTTSNFRTKFQDVRGKDGVAYSASMIVRMDNNAMDSAGGIGRAGLNLSFIDKDGKSITGTTVFIDASALKKPTLVINDNKIAPTGTKYVRVTLVASGKVNAYYTRIMLNRGAKVLPYTASTGQVIVGSDMIVDGAIIAKHLSAESVTAEKLAVGAVNMGSAVVTGTLDANRINVINLDASQIKVGTLNAATVRIINLDASAITTGTLNVAVQINANSIVAGTLNAKLLTGDTAHLNSVDTGNITNNYDYHLQVSSKGLFNKTTNVGQLNLHSTQSGGTDWDAAFPGSMTYHFETSTNGQNTGLRFWKNHIMSLNKDQNTGLYLNPYGGTQVRVTSRTDDNIYLAINASAFNVASDRRFKSDIEDYEEDALSIVNGLRIRTYKKSGKREIGVIADEAPKALLLKDETGDMLSLYDYSSIAIKAIQELTDEVDLLKSQIEEMEKKIA
ncbi:phage tail spike protein [Lactococcus formosensis]|uniref:phage tail spike protein n=1 Tax=Lactococcus formosensis TaxID=1281486 RepID=UPI003264C28B